MLITLNKTLTHIKHRIYIFPFLILFPLFPLTAQQIDENQSNANIKQTVEDQLNLIGLWEWEGRPMHDRDVIRNGRMCLL